MPYLAGFEHDIFVSYAHGPVRPGFGGNRSDRLGQWSRQLIDDLAEEILVSLGTKDTTRQFSIWMDPQLQGNQPLTDTLKDKIERSAVLVVVMSDFLLQSAWCREEIAWFRAACQRRGDSARGRIFVVRAFATDQAAWPEGLLDSAGHPLVGYRFHAVGTAEHSDPRPFGWPLPTPGDVDYGAAMKRLAADLSRELRGVPPTVAARPAAPPPREPAAERTGQRSVFLGCMHDTVDEERAELRERLAAAGLTVLPPEDEDPTDEASLRAVIDRYLPRANAMVLVANAYCGTWPKEEPGGFVSLQISKARELQTRCDLWLQVADVTKVRRADYRQYLETLIQEAGQSGLTIRHDELPAFADEVVRKSMAVVEPVDGVQKLDLNDAVICVNRPTDPAIGRDFLETIKATLSELQQESFTFDFADPAEQRIKLTNLEKRIRGATTLLVLCFDQDWDWARPFLRLLNGLGEGRNSGKVRLLVAGPRDRQEARYDARALGFATVDGIDKDVQELREMIRVALAAAAPGLRAAAEKHCP